MISAVCIFSGVLLSVVPKGKLKSAYKTLASILLVYTFLYPLFDSSNVYFNISDYLSDNYQVSENLDKYALSSMIYSAENAIEKLLTESLKQSDFSCEISAECSFSSDEIIVDRLNITGEYNNEQKSKIKQIITDFGFNSDIIKFSGE